MRHLVRFAFLFAFVHLLILPCPAQEASKTIEQYVKATGGSTALSRLQTFSLDCVIQSGSQPQDPTKPATYSVRVKQPNRYYTELQSNGKTIIEAYNGKSVWLQDASGETSTLLGPEALQIEAAAEYYNSRWLALSRKKIGAAFKGTASLHGHQTSQVELTYPTGIQWEVFSTGSRTSSSPKKPLSPGSRMKSTMTITGR